MPILNDKEYPDLNYLDLIIVATYKRYRKSEDHALSAFWTKMVMGFCFTLLLFSLWEIVIAIFELHSLNQYILDHYLIYLIFGVWAGMTYVVHKITIPNHMIQAIELYPEEYLKGQILGWSFVAFSTGLIILILTLTQKHTVY